MKNSMLYDTLSAPGPSAWWLLKAVVANFLGNKLNAECEKEVDKHLKKYLKRGVSMSFKKHFPRSHLDDLP